MSNTRGKALSKVLQLSRAFSYRPLSPSAHLHKSSEPSLGTIRFTTSTPFLIYYYLVSAIDETFNETSTVNNPTFHSMPSSNDPNREYKQDPLPQSIGLDQPELSHIEHGNQSFVDGNRPVNKDTLAESISFTHREYSHVQHTNELFVGENRPVDTDALAESISLTNREYSHAQHTNEIFVGENRPVDKDEEPQSIRFTDRELSHVQRACEFFFVENRPVDKDEEPQSIRFTDRELSHVQGAKELFVGENRPVDKDALAESISLTHREYSHVQHTNELFVGENRPVDKDEEPESIHFTDRGYSHVQHAYEFFFGENHPVDKDEEPQSIRLSHRELSHVQHEPELVIDGNARVDKDAPPQSIGGAHPHLCHLEDENESFIERNCPDDKVFREGDYSVEYTNQIFIHANGEINEDFFKWNESRTSAGIKQYNSFKGIRLAIREQQLDGFCLPIVEEEKFKEDSAYCPVVMSYLPERQGSIRKHLSRAEIQEEIGRMVMNIVAPVGFTDAEPMLLVDGYAHMDILFEKLNKANQTIFDYIHHNRQLYSYGAHLKYLIQSYSTAYHLKPENWSHYSAYLNDEVVYGVCGIQPFFANEYDLSTELNLRKALSHKRILGLGEIGLDYISARRPSPEIQQQVFFQQLQLAKEFDLPVVIISRGSFLDTLNILMKVLDSDYMINWRNFIYSSIELNMVISKFPNIHFGCSPYHLTNINQQNIIHQIDISKLIPESVCPHLIVPEVDINTPYFEYKEIIFLFLVPPHFRNTSHLCYSNLSTDIRNFSIASSSSRTSTIKQFQKLLQRLAFVYVIKLFLN
ncbi:unnamed protein product [Rotaria sp. Silwood2]|nr:unnamed protein product [Rotaria sp. Silwood2]CAF4066544.1 unnamed protein product [Rotaria sp. Silwood2]CAF4145264.1 unnamed protein product [Rotaria sp. Silwood2]CAF4236785.1 unnamed protein product [Rotaria sp. Silwood2]